MACEIALSDVVQRLNARLVGNSVVFNGVTTDSRSEVKGKLFVALHGDKFDAHEFASDVQAAGAAALLVAREMPLSIPQLIVKDTLEALGQLAAFWRSQLSIPIMAVTGSNGKTTVKEMLAAIFSQNSEIVATIGNLNNHIGVPLTLLSIGKQHTAAIIEMGANHPGEIAYLTRLARPHVAVINNAGAAHLEGFGTLENVAKAKGEIYQGLDERGVAVINADDQFAPLWEQLTQHNKQLTFGIQNRAEVSGQWQGDIQGNRIDVTTPIGDFSCVIKLLGKHNVMNALAATAVAVGAGVDLDLIKSGLESLQPVPGRMQIKAGINGSRIINDTYNANPYSLRAGLEVLAACEGDKYLVLGDMGELGENVDQLHQQAGLDARQAKVDKLFTLGKFSRSATTAFGENAEHFDDVDRLIAAVSPTLTKDTTVLVKGSRAMRMERVVEGIQV